MRVRTSTVLLIVLLLGACGSAQAEPTATRTSPAPRRTSAPPDSSGCTQYVAPGDDLQSVADSAIPGDTICFQPGTYQTDEIALTVSGMENQPIVFMALPGAEVILDGGGEAEGILTFDQGTSYVEVRGLTLRGFSIWGISVLGDNHHIRLEGLDVGGGEAGIHFTVGDSGDDPEYGPVDHITLADSFIHDAVYTTVDCTPGPCDAMTFSNLEISGAGMGIAPSFAADGLAVERGRDIVVSGCLIHDNGGDGIDLNSRDFAGNVEGIVVQGNFVYRNQLQAIKLWAGGTMVNNAVWGNGINPVTVGTYPGEYVVVHNTIAYNMWDPAYSARDYAFIAAYPEGGQSAAISLTLLNNIFAFNTGPEVGGPTGIYLGEGVALESIGGNLFYSRADGEIQAELLGPDTWLTQDALGAWGISGDPLFVSGWPEVDLRLQEGSPAIDAGSVTAFNLDISGEARDASPDIGAYEFR